MIKFLFLLCCKLIINTSFFLNIFLSLDWYGYFTFFFISIWLAISCEINKIKNYHNSFFFANFPFCTFNQFLLCNSFLSNSISLIRLGISNFFFIKKTLHWHSRYIQVTGQFFINFFQKKIWTQKKCQQNLET